MDARVGSIAIAAGPVPPGQSVTVQVDRSMSFSRLSAVGMLVTTNDGFFSLDGEAIPLLQDATYYADAYDAGSEFNSEDCDFIPGPPCGSHNAHDPSEAEGFIYIHAGIHGVGDLAPADFDWRNPVAKITVRRVRSVQGD
jgi:hypothetical protein